MGVRTARGLHLEAANEAEEAAPEVFQAGQDGILSHPTDRMAIPAVSTDIPADDDNQAWVNNRHASSKN